MAYLGGGKVNGYSVGSSSATQVPDWSSGRVAGPNITHGDISAKVAGRSWRIGDEAEARERCPISSVLRSLFSLHLREAKTHRTPVTGAGGGTVLQNSSSSPFRQVPSRWQRSSYVTGGASGLGKSVLRPDSSSLVPSRQLTSRIFPSTKKKKKNCSAYLAGEASKML